MRHIAIVNPQYAHDFTRGLKTIEARLTRVRCAPHGRVTPGDTVLFKAKAGSYTAKSTVTRVITLDDLTPAGIRHIRETHNHAIRADPSFWRAKRNARYATLLFLEDPRPITRGPALPKPNRAPWLCLPLRARPANPPKTTRPRPTTRARIP